MSPSPVDPDPAVIGPNHLVTAARAADWLNRLLVADRAAVRELLGVAIPMAEEADAIGDEHGRLTFLSALNSILKPGGELVSAHYTDEGTLIRFGTISLDQVTFA